MRAFLRSIVLLELFVQLATPASAQSLPVQPPPVQLDARELSAITAVLTDEIQAKLGFVMEPRAGGFEVLTVRDDTPANRAGLVCGDRVIGARLSGQAVEMTINRGRPLVVTMSVPSAEFRTRLPRVQAGAPVSMPPNAESPFPLSASKFASSGSSNVVNALPPLAPSFASNAQQNSLNVQPERLRAQTAGMAPLTANLQTAGILTGRADTGVRILANYNVELIIDASLSMRLTDCPGFMSRWQWCGMQAQDLSDKLAPFFPRGLNITTFASRFDVYENSTPQRIAELFHTVPLARGTRLAEPLQERISRYLQTRAPNAKPLLICIITDGVPAPQMEPAMVAHTLIDATKQMRRPGEITVVFFQIGGRDMHGRQFLADMDNGLMRFGAKFDIVRTVPFEELERLGLANALVNTIKSYQPDLLRP